MARLVENRPHGKQCLVYPILFSVTIADGMVMQMSQSISSIDPVLPDHSGLT